MYEWTVVIEKYAGVRHRRREEAKGNRNAGESLCGPLFPVYTYRTFAREGTPRGGSSDQSDRELEE